MTSAWGSCRSGFNGSRCELNPDDCAGVSCVHGRCVDGAGDYTCRCRPGYTGRMCESELDECDSRPCQYGGTCVDQLNHYVCHCPTGTTGTSSRAAPCSLYSLDLVLWYFDISFSDCRIVAYVIGID